jgi:hypothetical protein
VTDEQKEEYVQAYFVKEMLELNPDNIFKNSGWRHISYIFAVFSKKNENYAYFSKMKFCLFSKN